MSGSSDGGTVVGCTVGLVIVSGSSDGGTVVGCTVGLVIVSGSSDGGTVVGCMVVVLVGGVSRCVRFISRYVVNISGCVSRFIGRCVSRYMQISISS